MKRLQVSTQEASTIILAIESMGVDCKRIYHNVSPFGCTTDEFMIIDRTGTPLGTLRVWAGDFTQVITLKGYGIGCVEIAMGTGLPKGHAVVRGCIDEALVLVDANIKALAE